VKIALTYSTVQVHGSSSLPPTPSANNLPWLRIWAKLLKSIMTLAGGLYTDQEYFAASFQHGIHCKKFLSTKVRYLESLMVRNEYRHNDAWNTHKFRGGCIKRVLLFFYAWSN
jgi:hypothetical protein